MSFNYSPDGYGLCDDPNCWCKEDDDDASYPEGDDPVEVSNVSRNS